MAEKCHDNFETAVGLMKLVKQYSLLVASMFVAEGKECQRNRDPEKSTEARCLIFWSFGNPFGHKNHPIC